MKGYMETPEELKLDDQEAMEFHYFKLHDYDNNNKLDGLELGAAMTHYEDHRQEEGEGHKMRVSLLPLPPLLCSVYIYNGPLVRKLNQLE